MADPDERGGAAGPAAGAPEAAAGERKKRKPDTGLFGFDEALLAALEAEDDDELVITGEPAPALLDLGAIEDDIDDAGELALPSEPAPLSLGGLDLDDDLSLTDGIEPADEPSPAPLRLGSVETQPPFDSGIDAAFGDSAPPVPLATVALGPVAVDTASRSTDDTGVLANPVVPSPYGEAEESGILAIDEIEELDEADLVELADASAPPPTPPALPVDVASASAPAAEPPAVAELSEPSDEPAESLERLEADPEMFEYGLDDEPVQGPAQAEPVRPVAGVDPSGAEAQATVAAPRSSAPSRLPADAPDDAVVEAPRPGSAPSQPEGASQPAEGPEGPHAPAAAEAEASEGSGAGLEHVPSAPPAPVLAVPDGPPSLLDSDAVPPGVRLLVTLPVVEPTIAGEVFPEHSPAAPDWSWGEGAGLAAALPKPQSALPRAAEFDGLLTLLSRAIEGEADPVRLGSLCVAYGTLSLQVYGDLDVALAAARAAVGNAPTLKPAQRLIHEVHRLRGDPDERLSLLERGDASALARAGHLGWRLGQHERAFADWGWAAEYDPAALGPMLASLLALSAQPGLRDERAVLQWALARAQTPTLWQALALEQLRLNMRDEPDYADAWAEDALQRLEPSAALGALVERHALARGHAELLGAALTLRSAAEHGPAAALAGAWVAEAAGDLDAFGRAVDGAHGAPAASLGWLAARARRIGHADGEAAALTAAAGQVGVSEVAAAIARRLASLSIAQGATSAARAHLKRAMADRPADPVGLTEAGQLDPDPRAGHARATAEIEALEAQLAGAEGDARAALVARLVDRYHRVILGMEGPLGATTHAAAWAKRALALAPDGLDAVLVLEAHFAAAGDWARLAALALGRAERASEAAERRGWLHIAAELFQHRLKAPAKALTVHRRILELTPDDRVARAAMVEAALSAHDWAAAAEAQEGLAAVAPPADQAVAFGVAGRLAELAGDAPRALKSYQAALTADPQDALAADGVVRLASAGGDVSALSERARAPETLRWDGLAATQLADALLAAGLDAEAHAFLQRWRGAAGELDEQTTVDLALIEGWLAERRGDWPAVVQALKAQAAGAEGRTRGHLLARLGEIAEVRLGAPDQALAAYEAALDADPANPAARDGFVRLGPPIEVGHAGGPWSQRAREAPSLGDRHRILAAEAQQLPEGPTRDAMMTLAGRAQGDSAEARSARSATAGRARTAAVRAVAHAVAAGDADALEAAVEALREEGGEGPLWALATRRLAMLRDEGATGDAALDKLSATLCAPAWRAAALRARVRREEAAGSPSLETLEAAVLAAPDDAERGQRLAERLIAAQAWSRLEALYEAQAGAASTFEERLALARAQAGLRAERFDDPAAGFALLLPFVDQSPDDVDTALRAAQYAERAGDHAGADRCFDVAFNAEGGVLRAAVAHARALEARGVPEAALARLDQASERVGEERTLLELQAEIRSRLRDWSGVVRTLLRLLEVEPTPQAKAHRAMAIGRILSRVVQDHRRAAGWFKRAVELDPDQLKAVWFMLSEVEQLPADQVPVEHVEDALHRAVEAVRVRLAASPSDAAVLQDLFRLQRARGDVEGARWAAEALQMLGEADEKVVAALAERPRRRQVPVARDAQRIAWLLVHRRETRPAGALFALTAPALRAALGRPPTGPAVDGAEVEGGAWLEAWGRALGLETLRVVQGGLAGGYGPEPVLRAPAEVLAGQGNAGDLFDVGCTLEGLRDGRLLATRLTVDALEASVRTVAVAAGVVEATRPRNRAPDEDALRTAAAATGIPAGPLATEFERAGGSPDFARFADAVRASAHRAGLLVCEDLAAAIERVAALTDPSPTDFAVAVERDPAARALYLFALGPAHGALRRGLGLGEAER